MKKRNIYFSLFIVFVFITFGCSKNDTPDDLTNYDLTLSKQINQFIVEVVEEIYLWESETDWYKYNNKIAFANYTDHYKLFSELKYKDDHWSMLTDDIEGLREQFDGINTTFGYSLSLYKLISGNIIGVILYTSPGSPAEKAGLKRGDVIVEMNSKAITESNYLELYYASSLDIRCGIFSVMSKTYQTLPETISLRAVNMYEDPINTYTIIEKEGHKIGYLCLMGYQMESEKELVRIFTDFKSGGVTDVVLDLRYNPGGYARTAQFLCSILAPESVVKNKNVYLEHKYNDLLTNEIKSSGDDLVEYFIDTLSVNMNLSRLYVLTSKKTASASEATMVGLEPYLDLIQVGEVTSGKYCGGMLISPENKYGSNNKNYYAKFSNWGMYIMIYRFFNIKGISSFTSGLVPEIYAEEDDFNLKPFGDEADPLLGRALAHILNKEYVESRAGKILLPVTQLPDIKRVTDGLMIYQPSSLPIFSSPGNISE